VSKRGRDLTADEDKLWRRVTERVKPRRKTATKPKELEAPHIDVAVRPKVQTRTAPVAASKLTPVAPPADRAGERRVRRGKLEIGGKLDLHGHTQDSAQTALSRFLRAAHGRGDRTVIVITGVGRAGQGVLKQRVPEWLAARELRAIVSGFAQAHRVHGGAGAYYIFLKRSAD
jgi:DNA-nicking Smr family endonuclease